MKPIQGLAAVLAVAALAGGGAVAAASSNGGGTGTITTTTATGTTSTTPTPGQHRHFDGGPGRGFAFGFGGGLDFFDSATKTALSETFSAVQTAQKTATDAGKAPDDVRDAAIAAAKARLDQAVSDGALTKAQGAAVLAALTTQLGARAAVIDAAATVLKLTPTDLAKRLASGARLDEIATAQGVNLQDVFAAIQKAQGTTGGPGFGFGFGLGGPGMHGGFGDHGFGGRGPGHWDKGGNPPPPPTQTQPESGGFSGKIGPSTSHI